MCRRRPNRKDGECVIGVKEEAALGQREDGHEAREHMQHFIVPRT